MMQRILLAEDEEHLQEIIRENLEMEGYHVQTADNGKLALQIFQTSRFDLLILDVMMPEIDGLSVCETIRLQNREVPILFITAKADPADRVAGLKRGADDYLTKPFNLEEFLLRVKNLIRRGSAKKDADNTGEIFRFDENEINFSNFEIKGVNGLKQTLTKKEISLLKLLIDRRNEVVSRELILEMVWGYDVYPSTRTVDNFILSFRKYFEKNPREPKYFFSIRGVGYKFVF